MFRSDDHTSREDLQKCITSCIQICLRMGSVVSIMELNKGEDTKRHRTRVTGSKRTKARERTKNKRSTWRKEKPGSREETKNNGERNRFVNNMSLNVNSVIRN